MLIYVFRLAEIRNNHARTAAKSKTRIPQPCTPSLEEEKEEKKDYAYVQYGHAAKWLFQGTVPHNID